MHIHIYIIRCHTRFHPMRHYRRGGHTGGSPPSRYNLPSLFHEENVSTIFKKK
jgi:hypothetical protein